MQTTSEVFPSFLELFAYAELVTSGPGPGRSSHPAPFLPFIGVFHLSPKQNWRSNLKEILSLSLFLSSSLSSSLSFNFRFIDQTSQPVSSFMNSLFRHLRAAFYFHSIIIDECINTRCGYQLCAPVGTKVIRISFVTIKNFIIRVIHMILTYHFSLYQLSNYIKKITISFAWLLLIQFNKFATLCIIS